MMAKPPYYRVRKGRGFFELGRERAERAGMEPCYALGPDGVRARASAAALYADWEEATGRREPSPPVKLYPPGSLGSWYENYQTSAAWARKSSETREEWRAMWKHIGPELGAKALRDISPAEFEAFQEGLPLNRRWRVVKIARALFNAAVKYRVLAASPAKTLPNPMPAGRTEIWFRSEIPVLLAAADKVRRPAMRLAIQIAWQTLFSPVDVRRLTLAQRHRDGSGAYFMKDRSKTGKRAFGVLTADLDEAIDAYMASLPFTVRDDQPFLRTPTGHEYRKNRFREDFALVRAAAFGKGEKRRFQDFRRSGNVEAELAGASAEQRAEILANSLDRDPFLEETYTPATVARARKQAQERLIGSGMLAAERVNLPCESDRVVGTDKGKSSA